MNKLELVREVAARTASSQAATARIVEEFLGAVARSLSDGRRGRAIRNPRNGRVYRIPGKLAPVFRSSRLLVESVDRAVRED
jgi:nucleoid DNA-binding protein